MARRSGRNIRTLLKRKKSKNIDKKDKNEKEKVDMSNVINYGLIVIFTLFFIICFTFIIELKFDKITNRLNVSAKGTKSMLFLVLLVTYVTFILYPVKKLFDKQVLLKKAPKGERGIRGDRGTSGERGACGECSSNGLCYKKILYNITNTYNLWLKIKGRPMVSKNYVIKNEFLKDKIKKHCSSKEFKAIMAKYGSNTKNDKGRREGIYDYLNKLWSIWILIILKYDKGEYFITSENIGENHFMGLITENDSFQNEEVIIESESVANQKTKKIYTSNIGFPYFIIKDSNGRNEETLHIKDILNMYESTENNHWKIIIDENDYYKKKLLKNMDSEEKTKKIQDITKDYGFNYEYIKKETGVPGRGKFSPFDEIKKYTAWYWGSDDFTNPEIEIKNSTEIKIDTEINKNLKLECGNYKDNGSFKKLPSNNFYKVWSSDHAMQKKNSGGTFTPFQLYGDKNITILRCHHYINEEAKHPKFRTYKPLGDVIVSSGDVDSMPFESGKCFPDKLKYNMRILPRITDHNGTPFDENNIQTYLVAGDVKPPESYKLVYSCNIKKGMNKKISGLHVWKPVAPPEYIALGYIFDKRYLSNLDNHFDIDGKIVDKKYQPSTDLIYCVHKNSIIDIGKEELEKIPHGKLPNELYILKGGNNIDSCNKCVNDNLGSRTTIDNKGNINNENTDIWGFWDKKNRACVGYKNGTESPETKFNTNDENRYISSANFKPSENINWNLVSNYPKSFEPKNANNCRDINIPYGDLKDELYILKKGTDKKIDNCNECVNDNLGSRTTIDNKGNINNENTDIWGFWDKKNRACVGYKNGTESPETKFHIRDNKRYISSSNFKPSENINWNLDSYKFPRSFEKKKPENCRKVHIPYSDLKDELHILKKETNEKIDNCNECVNEWPGKKTTIDNKGNINNANTDIWGLWDKKNKVCVGYKNGSESPETKLHIRDRKRYISSSNFKASGNINWNADSKKYPLSFEKKTAKNCRKFHIPYDNLTDTDKDSKTFNTSNIWKSSTYINGDSLENNKTINFIKGNYYLADVKMNNNSDYKKYEFNNQLECTDYIKKTENGNTEVDINDVPTSLKDPKYSILQIYK